MKNKVALFLMIAAIGLAFVSVTKADPNRPQRPHFDPNAVRGIVQVTLSDSGTVTAIKIENRRNSWNVVLDAKGLELAKSANKMVFVEGTVAEQNGEKWVTVKSYKEIQRREGGRERHRRGEDPNGPPPGGPDGPPPGGPQDGEQ